MLSAPIRYVEWGDREAPPVVLLHGLRGYAHWYDDLADALSSAHHVVSMDLRGRGGSGRSLAGDYRADAHVDDLEDLLETLAVEQVSLVGHSLGGIIALLFAARHPNAVERMVLADVCPVPDRAGLERITGELAATPARFGSWEEAGRFIERQNPSVNPERTRTRVEWMLRGDPDGSVTWRIDDAVLGGPPPVEPASRLWRAVRLVACPTLVVRGERSDIVSQESAEELVALLPPGSELCEIAGAGHMLLDDNPDGVADAVTAFLRFGARTVPA